MLDARAEQSLRRLAPDIFRACDEAGEKPYLVAAMWMRESGVGWAKGYVPAGSDWGLHIDGHGHGLGGFDDRYNVLVDRSPLGQARTTCSILRKDRRWFLNGAFNVADPNLLERAAIAAYNAGPHSVYKRIVAGEDVDLATSAYRNEKGELVQDYSRWCLARAAELQAHYPAIFNPAP